MAGRTGYTAITNASAMLGPAQITGVYEHFDDLVGESVASAASLPSSGNWVGRTVLAEDTGIQWVCTELPNTWKPFTSARAASGTVAIAGTISSASPVFYSESIPITFPAGRFTSAPFVSYSYDGPGVGWADSGTTSVSVSGASARAFRLVVAPSGSVRWFAVQL